MPVVSHGLAVPCFREDPAELIRLGADAERAGFDGFFLWDHLVWSDTGEGPPIVDPQQVLAAVAVSTTRIRIGTLITRSPAAAPGSWPRKPRRWIGSAAGGSSLVPVLGHRRRVISACSASQQASGCGPNCWPGRSRWWPRPAGSSSGRCARVLAPALHGAYDVLMSSTKSVFGVDLSSPIPLHEQVAAAIRRAIADGEVGPGDRLPPARDLAAVLGVNANTVFRALRALRDEGLLEFRRGRGVTVTGAAPQRSAVVAKARELVEVARRYGLGPDELVQVIRQVS